MKAQRGKRYRITFETEVPFDAESVDYGSDFLLGRDQDGHEIYLASSDKRRSHIQIEEIGELSRPKPRLDAGDVVRTGCGRTVLRTIKGWVGYYSGRPYDEADLRPPLTLLVRRAKSVAR